MDQKSTNQIQGQEQASSADTTTIQIQSIDTSNIQLQNSNSDKVTQNCNVNLNLNMTSSSQISKPQLSTTTQTSCEAHKPLIRNLYNVLMCEKLPATEEIFDLSKKIEDFIGVLEVLNESCECDKIRDHDYTRNCEKFGESKNKDDKFSDIKLKYENLKSDEVLMKIIFHKCFKPQSFELDGNLFNFLKDYQSENQKFIFKDFCDTFETIIIPKTQALLSSAKSTHTLSWDTINDKLKSMILKSFIDFQGFYIPLQELSIDSTKHLQSLNSLQILDIIQYGFTKVSEIEKVPFYLKRKFLSENLDYFQQTKSNKLVQTEYTKNYDDLKKDLKNTKVLILADDFGSGKTATLKYFARRFKEDGNSLWISYIDANLSSAIFDRIQKVQEWKAGWIAEYLVKILALSGVEASIFMQKFNENKVILLWDHVDGKFQSTLIDFALNIKNFTENQQIIATRFKYSENFTRPFKTVAYKFIPFTTTQIEKIYSKTEGLNIDYEKFVKYCDFINLRDKIYDDGRRVLVKSNVLMFKLILEAFVDLKMDADSRVDLYLLIERIFKKQILEHPHKLTEDEEITLTKFLQAHALQIFFGDQITKSSEIIQKYKNLQPKILSLAGIFSVNADDNSIEFYHTIIQEYFIAKFIVDSVFSTYSITAGLQESKVLVTIVSIIISKHTPILKLINNAIHLKYKNLNVTKKLNDNFMKSIEKAQYLSLVEMWTYPLLPKFFDYVDEKVVVINDFELWERVYRFIPYEDEVHRAEELKNQPKQQPEIKKIKKKSKGFKDKPTIKGVTSMKKLNYNHEISNQLDEFLESDDGIDKNDD